MSYTIKKSIEYLEALEKELEPIFQEFCDRVYIPFWSAFDVEKQPIKNLARRINEYADKVVIECPGFGTYAKVEVGYNNMMELNRLSMIPIPCFYGYLCTDIKEEDGDPLDVYVLLIRPFTKELFERVQVIKVYVLTIIDMEDSNERDRKAIAIPADLLAYVVNYEMFKQNMVYAINSILTTILCFKERPHARAITKVHGFLGYVESQEYLTKLRLV
jgi:inorganic pyrophosphatase